MKQYPLIMSTLGGIYGAQTFRSNEHASAELTKDLGHEPFRIALTSELKAAFSNPELSWIKVLNEAEVACVDTEEEAIGLARELLWVPVFGDKTE